VHVLAAAPLLANVLATCPALTVLVTSRAALHLTGEHEFPVSPLALPDLAAVADFAALATYPSLALFVARRPPTAGLHLPQRTHRRSRRSACDSTACRARCSRSWVGDCRCSRVARATCQRGSRRSAIRSPGAMTCSATASDGYSVG
jgi:hypothetical protein